MTEFNDRELKKLIKIAKSVGYRHTPLSICRRKNFDTREEQMEALRAFTFTLEQRQCIRPLLRLRRSETLLRTELVMMLPHIKFLFGKLPPCIKSSIIRYRNFLSANDYHIVKRRFDQVQDNDVEYFIHDLRRCVRSYRHGTETSGHLRLALRDPQTFLDLMPRSMEDRWIRG
jgi:hypothetical protein